MEQQYQQPKIEANPQKPLPFQIIDTLTGGVTDPEAWKFGSNEENVMRLASILTSILGAQAGLKTITGASPQRFNQTLRTDPYGLKDGPMDRRVFFDKLAGNRTAAAKNQEQKLWADVQKAFDTENRMRELQTKKLYSGDPNWSSSSIPDLATEKMNVHNDFAKQFENRYGWPNAVLNPEVMGKATWTAPGQPIDNANYYITGPVAQFYELLKRELIKRP